MLTIKYLDIQSFTEGSYYKIPPTNRTQFYQKLFEKTKIVRDAKAKS